MNVNGSFCNLFFSFAADPEQEHDTCALAGTWVQQAKPALGFGIGPYLDLVPVTMPQRSSGTQPAKGVSRICEADSVPVNSKPRNIKSHMSQIRGDFLKDPERAIYRPFLDEAFSRRHLVSGAR